MKIGGIDTSKEVLVIAEIGNNHEGDFELAKRLVGLAAKAGAQAVKFQTIVPEKLVSGADPKRVEQLRKLCLVYDDFEKLHKVCRDEGMIFLSTPFDIESVKFLEPLVPAYKIASGDNNFYALLEAVAATGKPIIMSTGLTERVEVSNSVEFISRVWKSYSVAGKLALLHCVSSYPTQPQDATLRAIEVLKTFGCTVGYSDHTIGIEASILSVALGARIIEKHFTIDKKYSDFPDHKLSCDPEDLRRLIDGVRRAELMLGEPEKRLLETEIGVKKAARRSIASSRVLKSGTVVAKSDITWLRPGLGIQPGEESRVIGKKLKADMAAGEHFDLSKLE